MKSTSKRTQRDYSLAFKLTVVDQVIDPSSPVLTAEISYVMFFSASYTSSTFKERFPCDASSDEPRLQPTKLKQAVTSAALNKVLV
ncbi:hypothetical protein L1D31_06390 [Vibrio sp. Isolate23]|uniref:hypothetical protein n=1 Tax=Vibrio sp. Isolate23 TaxID=2908533 RepID=UPI001EFDF7AD|nr:hypothetical protein [Vibrio sp. Isolate23]MCG9682196.1 hypothetical protein [Vibrio sp. Isolate23]